MPSSFKQLRIWQKGLELVIKIYKITNKYYPREEKYGLTSDTRRSANSIIANIAESQGRYSFADQIRVLFIARGEISEIQSHLAVAKELGFLPEKIFQTLNKEYEGLGVGLNCYIRNLKKKKT